MPVCAQHPWLTRLRQRTVWGLLLTLLFLCAVGLRRLWDLRHDTGDALALLTGRPVAYGYRVLARFLALLAPTAAEPLTDALATWTATLWLPPAAAASPMVYIDGHRKPVYADVPLPRGLIGKTGKVLGCRALVLLHDAQGHILLATTHRGDQHLTVGLPTILARYEQATGCPPFRCVVVDREGMSAAWLRQMVAAGRTVITLLRSDQYRSLDSFQQVGPFQPLTHDAEGRVLREVASAHYALTVPGESDPLPLWVALIRDHRWQVPQTPAPTDPPARWDADMPWDGPQWWDANWEAPSAPAVPTEAKLIPLVCTAEVTDPLILVNAYTKRWPCQENIIRDWLIPLGIETNHGYAKTAVVNSEQAKQRTILEQRRDRVQRWTTSARTRSAQASRRADRRYTERKAQGQERYRTLNQQQWDLEEQGCPAWEIRQTIRDQKAALDADLDELNQRMWRAERERDQEDAKIRRYCQEQRQIVRALEDLAAHERPMYELDNRNDQVMTVMKVALVNLGMWVRDQYFPASYVHATWQRLRPFFALKGQITTDAVTLQVTLRPFNDRQLNRDLADLCARVAQRPPHLPDGRRLILLMAPPCRPDLDMQRRC